MAFETVLVEGQEEAVDAEMVVVLEAVVGSAGKGMGLREALDAD